MFLRTIVLFMVRSVNLVFVSYINKDKLDIITHNLVINDEKITFVFLMERNNSTHIR